MVLLPNERSRELEQTPQPSQEPVLSISPFNPTTAFMTGFLQKIYIRANVTVKSHFTTTTPLSHEGEILSFSHVPSG